MLRKSFSLVKGLAVSVPATLVLASQALASTATTGLPWEGAMTTLQQSFTGPVAMGVSATAVAGSGIALVFGEEMNDLLRRSLHVAGAAGLALGGVKVLHILYGSGALIH